MNFQLQSFNPWLRNSNSRTTFELSPQRRSSSSGGYAHCSWLFCPSRSGTRYSFKANCLELSRRRVLCYRSTVCSNASQNLLACLSHQPRNHRMRVGAASAESPSSEYFVQTSENETFKVNSYVGENRQPCPKYENKFLVFARLGSVINNAAESFFKSEIRRRLFVTAALLVISRIGYFIPLPGFDRKLVPGNYLSFVSGSFDELGEPSRELKLSLFQLGISPQIGASIVMQVLCYLVPSFVKLRKEGLDANEKIKAYTWWMSLGFATVEALLVSCFSLPYSIYAVGASQRTNHVILTTFLLVCGAMSTNWISEKISDSGFGQGSSLLICVNILTGYTDTLFKMLSQLSGNAVRWWPYILSVLGAFTVVTMWAVLVTQGCRKIKLQYYGFKLASSTRDDSPITEVEQYIPFNINPAGMQPVLTTSYLLGIPSIVASVTSSPFWIHVKEMLNPDTSLGAASWVYYSIYAFFVFVFNILDIANMPKEIADHLNKMGARIPNIKPGKATVEYLTKIQASTRFWGGLLLTILATSSTILDHHFRSINEGFSIGFTSVLIIVGSIIELRRSYQAYNVMPSLSKALRRYGV